MEKTYFLEEDKFKVGDMVKTPTTEGKVVFVSDQNSYKYLVAFHANYGFDGSKWHPESDLTLIEPEFKYQKNDKLWHKKRLKVVEFHRYHPGKKCSANVFLSKGVEVSAYLDDIEPYTGQDKAKAAVEIEKGAATVFYECMDETHVIPEIKRYTKEVGKKFTFPELVKFMNLESGCTHRLMDIIDYLWRERIIIQEATKGNFPNYYLLETPEQTMTTMNTETKEKGAGVATRHCEGREVWKKADRKFLFYSCLGNGHDVLIDIKDYVKVHGNSFTFHDIANYLKLTPDLGIDLMKAFVNLSNREEIAMVYQLQVNTPIFKLVD